MFDAADYERAAKALAVPVARIKAVAKVESAGETFWAIDGRLRVPVRFEAHVFGKRTRYRFNDDRPDLSVLNWTPGLAATTRAGAWRQVEEACALDRNAALESTSWGAFQIMGYHWQPLGYPSVQAFVDSMSADGDDGQMDAFVRFVQAKEELHEALKAGDYDDVELYYNGGGQGGVYATRMRAAEAMFAGEGAPAAPRVLRKGDRGADVAALQTALGIRADGDFGPQTDQAVRLFQADRGLVVDGIAGAMTRRALGI